MANLATLALQRQLVLLKQVTAPDSLGDDLPREAFIGTSLPVQVKRRVKTCEATGRFQALPVSQVRQQPADTAVAAG